MLALAAFAILIAAPDAPRTPAQAAQPPATRPAERDAPPKPNVDPGIVLPPDRAPEPPAAASGPKIPKPDSPNPREDSVKPVRPAPSNPEKPGVRPL